MLHQSVKSEDEGSDLALGYRTRIGIQLFFIYALVYVIFIVINLVSPLLMERIVFLGMNLAITYGIGLIVFAIFLALIYNRLCAKMEIILNHTDSTKKAA